ncbi:MAG TPA: SBBP repeat-containing protein [Oculatellaceae cyanobacterium]|jgi:hypothetical protein
MSKKNLAILSSLISLSLTTIVSQVAAQTYPSCSPSGTSATNLVVCSASYLGGSSEDQGSAVEVGSDYSVVFGGTIIGNNFGRTPVNLKAGNSTTSGGNGAIVRTSPNGQQILSVTRLGNSIDDLDVNRSQSTIAVVGDFGLALLSSQANQVLWSKYISTGGGALASSGRRVAVGTNGEVAALFNKKITIFNQQGTQLGQFTPSGSYVEDIAVDSASGSVIVTGTSQKDGGGCSQLQVAWIRSYSYTGTLKWKNYDWTREQAYSPVNNCADTRGVRVAIGRDNLLYFAGQSAGGNTIFRYNPRNLSSSAPNVKYDQYNDAYNTKSNWITYYSRLAPATGTIQKGQLALTRLGDGRGNSIEPRAITADENGNVYISGTSAAYIANRRDMKLSISGQPLGTYNGYEGFMLVVPKEFTSRKVWTAWTGTNSTSVFSTFAGVSAAKGIAAIMGTSNGKMITVSPIQGNNAGVKDAFFSVFPNF